MSKDSGGGLLRIDAPALGVAVLLTGLAFMGAVRPILASRARASEVLTELDDAVAAVRRVRADRADLEVAASAMRRELDGRTWKVEPVSELNQRLAGLTTLAGECGLTISQLTPGTTTPTARYTAVAMRLTARGSFGAFSSFISRLRGAFPDTGVVGLRASANPERGAADAECAVELVWFAAPAPVPAKK